ncbi:glutamate--cysteine ligase 2 [Streptomyces aureocirculatus]|uniref:glutamate--cysteine ligase 2 n=1 Tax=Streptomyces aureocirculatus TaxID=67275 RepID=UPI0004CA8D37|nr:glutamate--cysteine ligase [Streptomyces aureocirculatus]
MSPITVGVEEEYLLLDPGTGLPVPLAEQVRTAAGLGPIAEEREVQPELMAAQIEVATPVCTALDEVGGHLLRLRHALGRAAESHGCRLAACATPPLKTDAPAPVTDLPRYRALRARAPQLVAEQLVSGMHVHVAVPDPELGVAVLNRIRLWLPVLVAMSANSPFWAGRDTGFASWRTIVFGRWPVSGPPPHFDSLADHEQRIKLLLSSGAIMDMGQIYWQARLSSRYPTIEVRCADVQLRADEAVLLTGLVRALVATAVQDAEAGVPVPPCPPELLQAANWHAARYGLGGSLMDCEGRLRSAGDVLSRLMDHITPALDAAGDSREVTALVHRLLQEGTDADRQRRALADGGLRAVTELIVTETTAV